MTRLKYFFECMKCHWQGFYITGISGGDGFRCKSGCGAVKMMLLRDWKGLDHAT